MARQAINIGSSANDGTGDPLRTAFDKINDNFIELYGSDNDINTLDANLDVNNFAITTGVTNGNITVTPNGTGNINLGSITINGSQISSNDSTQITLADNIQTTGTLNVAGAATLATSLTLATGATVTGILDEDNMATNSATQLATQQSIKAYVDTQLTAEDLDFQADSGGALSIDLDSETMTFTGGTGIDTSGSGNTITFAIDSTVATLTGSQTLTNKVLTSPTINAATMTGTVTVDTISMADNTITTNASNANLELSANGSGQVRIVPNATVVGTLNTADITTTGTQTITGTLNVDGVQVKDNKVSAFVTNSNLELSASGTGVVDIQRPLTTVAQTVTGDVAITGAIDVDNIKIDGNSISSTNSNGGITIDPNGSGNINLTATNVIVNGELNVSKQTVGETLFMMRGSKIQPNDTNEDIVLESNGTGSVVVDQVSITDNKITTHVSNADLQIDTDGTGEIQILTNTSVSGTLTATSLTTNEITSNGSNADINIDPSGTGLVAISNLKVDGNIQINDNKIATTVSNSNLQLGANGSGTIELMSQTITSSSNIIFDAESDIILDAGGKDIIFRYDGAQFGLFTFAGGNLLIQSGSSTMLTGDGANAIFGGNITVPGSSTLDGVTITDNTIKSNASNADLQIGTSGTGVIDVLTATQSTVGSAGGASALPGQPTGYIKIKIGGTLRVIPFYDQA